MDVLCLTFMSNVYIIHEHFSREPLGLCLLRLVVGETPPFGTLLFFPSREGQACSEKCIL